jgi:hypothetical protein
MTKMNRRKAGKRRKKPLEIKYRGFWVKRHGSKEFVYKLGSKVPEAECTDMQCAIRVIDAIHGD